MGGWMDGWLVVWMDDCPLRCKHCGSPLTFDLPWKTNILLNSPADKCDSYIHPTVLDIGFQWLSLFASFYLFVSPCPVPSVKSPQNNTSHCGTYQETINSSSAHTPPHPISFRNGELLLLPQTFNKKQLQETLLIWVRLSMCNEIERSR